MTQVDYVVKDLAGIHARPAGFMRMKASGFSSHIMIVAERGKADIRNPIAVLGLNVRCGDRITIMAEGDDEEMAVSAMEQVLREYL